MPPHSIWISYGMDIFHGFHMDSMWNMFGPFMEYVELSHGMHIFHMESIWNGYLDSTWIPCSFHRIFPDGIET
jgi:hypothetical protein